MSPESENLDWKKIVVGGSDTFYSISENGLIRNDITGKEKKKRLDRDGYNVVVLWLGSGKSKYTTIHSLVAIAFLGPRPNGMQVNHKDGVKTNNHYSNMEYVTASENTRHAWKNGLSKKQLGESVSSAKLTREQVIFIKHSKGIYRATDLAKKFGVCQSNISHIWANNSWRHV